MHKREGFTIVELLIVIVVIAILAAISIVGFNGVKSRADKSSLSADLANAAKQLELANANDGTYPADFPPTVKASPGNVLSLTAVSDTSSTYCINGYGPGNITMSYKKGGDIKSSPCPGALIGSPVGGSVPGVPTNTNLVADFSNWTLSGGVTYDSATQEVRLNNSASGGAMSPLVRTDGANARFNVEAYATQPSPTGTPDSQVYTSSYYYGADGVTRVNNNWNYTGNGNAQALALNSWFNYSWSVAGGPDVKYVRFQLHANSGGRTSDNRYRNPSISTY